MIRPAMVCRAMQRCVLRLSAKVSLYQLCRRRDPVSWLGAGMTARRMSSSVRKIPARKPVCAGFRTSANRVVNYYAVVFGSDTIGRLLRSPGLLPGPAGHRHRPLAAAESLALPGLGLAITAGPRPPGGRAAPSTRSGTILSDSLSDEFRGDLTLPGLVSPALRRARPASASPPGSALGNAR